MSIRIPATFEDARAQLARLDSIATATGWERSAIVYAYTHDGRGRSKNVETTSLDATQFAKLGITGLTEVHTVTHYRHAWQFAVDAGKAVPVGPGDDVEVPDLEWPPNPTVGRAVKDPARRQAIIDAAKAAGMEAGSKALDIAANPRSLAVAIMADPSTAEAAREALAKVSLEELRKKQGPMDAVVREVRAAEGPTSVGDTTRFHLLADLRVCVKAADQAVATTSKFSGRLTDDERSFVEDTVGRLHSAASWLGDIAKSSLDDEALAQWLGEQS